jgi:hypothetical protein
MANGDISDIIVSFRSMQAAVQANETKVEAAAADKAKRLGDPWQQAAIMARIGQALRDMENAETVNAEPGVLVAPNNPLASRMQCSLAEFGTGVPVVSGGKELKFDSVTDPLGWAYSWLVEWDDNHHPIVRPKDTKAKWLDPQVRIAVLGDWGTGLYGAKPSAKSIEADKHPFTALLHLGDVYYAGTRKEEQQRFLELWPKRPEAFSRALNSNHEMYSGGQSYFEDTLKKFNQESSYFVLRNKNWTLIGLDTGWTDFDLDDEQVRWLDSVVGESEGTRIILFSHHQLFSQLDSQGTRLAVKLGKLLAQKKISMWYWGHEHRCVLYDPHPQYGLVARCIGHGGMPQRRGVEKVAPVEDRKGDAVWRRLPERKPGIPSALVLDGPNAFIKGKENTYGPHGYITLEFDGAKLHESVLLPDGKVVKETDLA